MHPWKRYLFLFSGAASSTIANLKWLKSDRLDAGCVRLILDRIRRRRQEGVESRESLHSTAIERELRKNYEDRAWRAAPIQIDFESLILRFDRQDSLFQS